MGISRLGSAFRTTKTFFPIRFFPCTPPLTAPFRRLMLHRPKREWRSGGNPKKIGERAVDTQEESGPKPDRACELDRKQKRTGELPGGRPPCLSGAVSVV